MTESSQENLTLRYNSDEIENHFRFENRSLFGNFNVNAGDEFRLCDLYKSDFSENFFGAGERDSL